MNFFLSSIILLFSYILFSEEVCDDILISDFSMDNCIAKQTENDTFYYAVDSKTCIPYCEKYPPDGRPRSSCPCMPGYMCERRCSGSKAAAETQCTVPSDCKAFMRSTCTLMCIANPKACMVYYANTTDYVDTFFTAIKFKPSCENDGLWKAKQCKGGVSGRCMCFDKFGTRLFGEARYSKSKTMTCACSRRRAELMDEGRNYVTLHCNSLGNYEKLQCDSGMCWCAEEQTGDLTSIVVPEKAVKKLHCYAVASVGNQYLRQCDSIKDAASKIQRALMYHGYQYVNLGTTLCDGDGGYGMFSISDGIAYCTKNDGSKIGGYQSDSSTNINTLTCRCARDYLIYNHGLSCKGNGNYRPDQSTIVNNNNYVYCVDADGFQKSNLETNIDDCNIYY